MDTEQIRARLDAIVTQVRTYVPIIAPYFDIEASLSDYSARLAPAPAVPRHAERQARIARAGARMIERVHGRSEATATDAADFRAANIVDHHQVLNHPLLLGTNVIANASRLLGAGPRRPIVTFSCADVPPTNYYMKNGFQLRGQPVGYFSAHEKHDAMYYVESRRFDFVERLHATKSWRGFAPTDQDFLVWYQDLLNGLDYSRCARHKDQLAVVIRATWPLLFAPELRAGVPELFYLNLEELTRACLLDGMLDEDSFVSATLFDPGLRERVLDAFRGVVIAWNEAAQKGTHFFWRKYPGRPQLLRMYVEGGALVPADPRFRELAVPLERAAIRDHLERDEIVPSAALIVSVLHMYGGIKPLVGPGSIVYFTKFKQGWLRVLGESGFADEAAMIDTIDLSGLIAGTPIFFRREADGVKTLYAADVIAQGGVGAEYLRTVLATRFKDILSVGVGGVYDYFKQYYIPKEELIADPIGFDEAASVVHRWL